MEEDKTPLEGESEDQEKQPAKPKGNTTYDLRAAAEEALRMLASAESGETTYVADPDDEDTRQGSTTFDLKSDAAAALRMFATGQGQPQTDKLDEISFFTPGSALKLDIHGVPKPMSVVIEDEVVIGRSDSVTGFMPDVDLTPFGAYRLGLSRRHIILKCKERQLFLIDLGSRNGTYLNGIRLEPHAIRALHNGDDVQLGKLSLRLIYPRE